MTNKGVRPWLDRLLAEPQAAECVIWPFNTLPNGYGTFGFTANEVKRMCYAHRYVCEVAHGPCPDGLEAAHSCHNRACVNPRHLSWKTRSANQLDRRENGTANVNTWGRHGKLSNLDRDAILALKGKATQREIAARFGCTFQNVSHIHRTRGAQ